MAYAPDATSSAIISPAIKEIQPMAFRGCRAMTAAPMIDAVPIVTAYATRRKLSFQSPSGSVLPRPDGNPPAAHTTKCSAQITSPKPHAAQPKRAAACEYMATPLAAHCALPGHRLKAVAILHLG